MPNTLNVMTNFPFLIIGVLGFVLCLGGSFFNIRLTSLSLSLSLSISEFLLMFNIFVFLIAYDKLNYVIKCSLKGEIWGWTLFYASVSSLAFGSAYYHLKPDDNRIVWDTLPVRPLTNHSL